MVRARDCLSQGRWFEFGKNSKNEISNLNSSTQSFEQRYLTISYKFINEISIKMLLEWPMTLLLMPFYSKLMGNLERRHVMLSHGFTNSAHWGWGVINAILRTASSTRRARKFLWTELSQGDRLAAPASRKFGKIEKFSGGLVATL